MTETEYLCLTFMEEATEVAHAMSKVLRFTKHDSHTIGGPSNLDVLEKEFNELLALKAMLVEKGILIRNRPEIQAMKIDRVNSYVTIS